MSLDPTELTRFCHAKTDIRELVHEVILMEEVSSTNEVALEMASNGLPGGLMLFAESQSGGRGRLDRHWFSPPGKNIYCSLLLHPVVQHRDYPLFSPATALGVLQGIEACTGLNIGIKWPNDLMVGEKKIGGILLATQSMGQQSPALVIGMGLNVNLEAQDFPSELQGTATSLKMELGRDVDRTTLMKAVIQGMATQIHFLQSGEVSTMISALKSHCVSLGRQIRVSTKDKVFEGMAEDITEDGALRVRLGDRSLREIVIGDITHLRSQTQGGRRR